MYEDDHEALAAEYVLGTLSADEREHAEGLLLIDPGFEAAVRQWERRLGELNVMVEAVEPPTEVWTKIKAGILSSPGRGAEQGEAGEIDAVGEADLPRIEEAAPHVPEPAPEPHTEAADTADTAELAETTQTAETGEGAEPAEEDAGELEAAEPSEELEAAGVSEELEPVEEPSEAEARLAAFELSLLPPNDPADATGARRAAPSGNIERGADVIYLADRLQNLRRLTAALGVVAALLAAYVAVWQIAPNLIPQKLRPSGAALLARAPAQTPARPVPVPDRLVAVLQPGPTAPAFLLTIDASSRILTVRDVSANTDAAHSYELWLRAPRSAKPRSLGLVGGEAYTQRPLPAGFDADTLGTATFEISYEPAGGSKTGAPTGPILFTGQAVESLPAAQSPKT